MELRGEQPPKSTLVHATEHRKRVHLRRDLLTAISVAMIATQITDLEPAITQAGAFVVAILAIVRKVTPAAPGTEGLPRATAAGAPRAAARSLRSSGSPAHPSASLAFEF